MIADALHILYRRLHGAATLIMAIMIGITGCGGPQLSPPVADVLGKRPSASGSPSRSVPSLPPAGSGRGGYYQDDGPGDAPPEGLLDIPDAEPQVEPYTRRGNRPYAVFGRSYLPIADDRPFKQRGIGSWYGKKFHGQMTSSGEIYDMYKMTAAHPTLPLPSYVRVTNLSNGRQIIVRVNDRGPFHSNRIIDLSYAAALKLGYLANGSAELEVERLLPDEIARMQSVKAAGMNQRSAGKAVSPAQAEAVVQPVVHQESISSMPPPQIIGNAASAQPVVPSPDQVVTSVTSLKAVDQASSGDPAVSNLFYLQLGAFGNATNAENMRRQLAQSWGQALPPLEVVQTGTMYRIFGGPFASRAEAEMAARQIQAQGILNPLIVRR